MLCGHMGCNLSRRQGILRHDPDQLIALDAVVCLSDASHDVLTEMEALCQRVELIIVEAFEV